MFGQTLIHIDGFGQSMRWSVVGVRVFDDVTVVDAKPEWFTDRDGNDVPDVVLNNGRVITGKVHGPVEKFQFLN